MEMALHEKEGERERAQAHTWSPPADAAHTGAPGHTRVCARAAWEVGVQRGAGAVPPREREVSGMGLRECRGLQSPSLPRRLVGRSAARAVVWRRGPRLLPQPSAADQSAGGSEQACASSAPGRAPPHLPAPLPREFVKQISLIAKAEEFVEEKSRGNSPPLGHPFPTSPGDMGRERAGPSPQVPRPPALREAATPTPAGCSCRVSSGHPCPHRDVPCSTSSELGRSRPSRPGPGVRPCHLTQ